MLLPASPASAAIPGLQRLVTTSPSNSTGNPKAASATCPAGKNVIGLGGYVTGGNGQVVLTELLPDAMSAKVRAVAYEDASGYDGDWSVTAVAVCADPPPGLQRVSTQSPGDSDAKEWTVTCPNGKKILGLGGRLNGFEGRILLDALQPFGGVSGQLHASEDAAGLSGNWSVTAVAMCADPGTWSRSRNARKPEPGTGDSSIKSSISWMNIHSQARTGMVLWGHEIHDHRRTHGRTRP